MKDVYNYDDIKPDTQVYGLVADPIGHDLSPIVQNAAFRTLDMNRVFVPFRVPHEYLSSFLHDCSKLDIQGLSVTAPHKQTIVNALAKIDKAVEGIGAVNTVVFHEDNKAFGYNTDYRAAMSAMAKASGVKTEKPFEGKRALVLGAGAIARAVVYGLREGGVEVVIASRTMRDATDLAEKMECRSVEWESRYQVKTDMLVNCTPVGMHPQVDETPYDGNQLRRNWLVFDAIYNPEQTLLIKESRQKGCRVVTGVDMFVRRAGLQFMLFADQKRAPGNHAELPQTRHGCGQGLARVGILNGIRRGFRRIGFQVLTLLDLGGFLTIRPCVLENDVPHLTSTTRLAMASGKG